MKNEPDMGKKNQENEQKPEWPREVLITQTLDSIAAELGDDYDEDDDNGLIAAAMMESTDSIEIESWEDFIRQMNEGYKGYELVDKADMEAYQAYLESKQRE